MRARHKLSEILCRAVLAVPAARNFKCAVPVPEKFSEDFPSMIFSTLFLKISKKSRKIAVGEKAPRV
jgi:hypothetical protein